MDASIISDVIVGGVLAALVLALWRDVRSLGERVARLEGWLERPRTSARIHDLVLTTDAEWFRA